MTANVTTKILKASDVRGLHSHVAFNFEDIRKRCEEHVDRVRAQARELLQTAQADAQRLRESAHAEGLAQGRREGLRDAENEIERRAQELAQAKAAETLSSLIPALQSAAVAVEREQQVRLKHWEESSLRMCVAIAEKLIRRKIETQPQIATDMIAHALKLAAGSPSLVLSLHSEDRSLLGENAEQVAAALSCCGTVAIVTDDTIARGGCRVVSEYGSVDATLDTMLARIVDEMIEPQRGSDN